MKTMGLNHIQIKVSDLNQSLKFYTGLLGMKEIMRHGRLVFLQSARGNDVVTLQQIGVLHPLLTGRTIRPSAFSF